MFNAAQFVTQIQGWGRELGFSQIGVSGVDLSDAEPGLLAWLAQGFHGDMSYMASHGLKRARPDELVPGTLSVVTARMDYLPRDTPPDWVGREWARLGRSDLAVVSLYARGRDYHKVLRQRLQKLGERMEAGLKEAVAMGDLPALQYRPFTDSAPVLEVELAGRGGLGWRGKHTLLLHRDAGSMFFLGEIYLNLALPATPPSAAHCGSCDACLRACPTGAIVAPYRVDARRCISYWTIEHPGPIPEPWRRAIGNRVYGCDDCQLACPWNKYARSSLLPDFDARTHWQGLSLIDAFRWDEAAFLRHTEGSAIRRIGHERWLRNVSVALGNALAAEHRPDSRQPLLDALATRRDHASPVVREHVQWAMAQAR